MNPENEQYVSVTTNAEVTCWECDEPDIHKNAILEGDQSTLAYSWDCTHCGHENTEVYSTDDFLG